MRFGGVPRSIAKVCLIAGVCTAGGAAGGAVGSILPTLVLGVSGLSERHRSSSSGPFAVGLTEHLLVRCAKEPHLKHALFKCSSVKSDIFQVDKTAGEGVVDLLLPVGALGVGRGLGRGGLCDSCAGFGESFIW